MANAEKLGAFLAEISNWGWDEFVKAERDTQYTSNQAIIFALIRACSLQNLPAIKLALNRLDGKLATPIKIEYPKIFFLYPQAKVTEYHKEQPKLEDTKIEKMEIVSTYEADEDAPDLPSMSLRETLSKMSDYPRKLPEGIVQLALQTEQFLRKQGPKPNEIPKVKSVVAAHLLIMAQNRNIDALTEVFDQIDGKLVETLKLIGEDIYITNYDLVAPDGAYLNSEGILQIEAKAAQDQWAMKLKERQDR